MIRLIQRRLIIPRGDTGTFSIPILAGKNSGDVSILTIFNTLTHRKIFEKVMEMSDGVLKLDFTHGDTVNLPVGDYVWDIKFYTDPVFADNKLVGGTEVDSYYAAFQLPVCEIRETGDNLLMADNAPDSMLAPSQLNYVEAALVEIENDKTSAENSAIAAANSASEAGTSAANAGQFAVSALDSKNAAVSAQASAESAASAAAASAFEAAAKATEVGAELELKANIADLDDVAFSGAYSDLSGVPTNVSSFTNDAGYLTQHQDISGKANSADLATVATSGSYNDLSNKPFIPSAVSDLTDDSGHYIKPVTGIPASDLEETYLTSFTETDPTVPSWAKAAQKPTYTAQEVGALPDNTYIPTKVSDLDNDSGYLTQHQDISGKANSADLAAVATSGAYSDLSGTPTNVSSFTNDAGYLTSESDPTVPSWAKAVNKPTYTASEVGAPTVSEMNTAISNAIGNVHQFGIEVVQELPTTGIKEHTIYFVPKTGETNDVYDEYIRVNNAWEMIGNTQIDLSNYVQKTDYATSENAGVVKITGNSYGLAMGNNGLLTIASAGNYGIKTGQESFRPITPDKEHMATFYGLAIAAGDTTQSQSDNAVGTYTNDAKSAIRSMLGVAASTDIPNVPVQDVQVNGSTVLQNGIANIPLATSSSPGLVRVPGSYRGIDLYGDNNESITLVPATSANIKGGTEGYKPVTPIRQHESIFYGLAKAAGDTTQAQSENAVGTYTDTAKTAIQSMLNVPSNIALERNKFEHNFLYPEYTFNKDDFESGQWNYATKVENSQTLRAKYLIPVKNGMMISYTTTATQRIMFRLIENENSNTYLFNQTTDYSTNDAWGIRYDGLLAICIVCDNNITINDIECTLKFINITGNASRYGIVKTNISYGITLSPYGDLSVYTAQTSEIKSGSTGFKPITPVFQHQTVFYGLSKAAGVDLKNETVTLGQYPDTSKAAIQNMLGITDLISTEESSTAIAAHTINSTFMMNGKLHRATATIAIGDAVEVGTNCEIVKADEVFVKKTDYGSSTNAGIVQSNNNYGVTILNGGILAINPAGSTFIKEGTASYYPIVPLRQHEAVFYGLSKLAGVDLANETVTVGTYPANAKTAIKAMLSIAEPSTIIDDTATNGETAKVWSADKTYDELALKQDKTFIVNLTKEGNTSVMDKTRTEIAAAIGAGKEVICIADRMSSYTAKNGHFFPLRLFSYHITNDEVDVFQFQNSFMTTIEGSDYFVKSTATYNGSTVSWGDQFTLIPTKVSQLTNDSDFYTKPSGGIPATDLASGVIPNVPVQDVQIQETSVVSNNIANIPIASTTTAGVVKVNTTGSKGIVMVQALDEHNQLYYTGEIAISKASNGEIKASSGDKPIVASQQHRSVFYGLAKAAGDSTQASSSNVIGTYTDDAKSAIRSMLGAAASADIPNIPVQDVQINEVSILNSGVANIPVASSSNLGVVKINSAAGIMITNGVLATNPATDTQIKAGTNGNRPICATSAPNFTFYGLAKAAGYDEKDSSEPLGTYTNGAKGAIQKMLGIAQMIAPIEEDLVADQNYTVGQLFIYQGKLYKVTADINLNNAITMGTNCTEINLLDYISGKADKTDTVLNTTLSRGRKSETIIGLGSFAFGSNVEASGDYSFACGNGTIASGGYSKAEGYSAVASGNNTHAEGNGVIANGSNTHAEGRYNTEQIIFSDWVENTHYNVGDRVYKLPTTYECITENTDASWDSSHWKMYGFTSEVALVIGNGTSKNARSNAYMVDWSGNGHYMGNVYIECNNDSTGGTRLATITEVAAKLDAAEAGLKVVRLI